MLKSEDFFKTYMSCTLKYSVFPKLSYLLESHGHSDAVLSSAEYVTDTFLQDFDKRKPSFDQHKEQSYIVEIPGRKVDFFNNVVIHATYFGIGDGYAPVMCFLKESGFHDGEYTVEISVTMSCDPSLFKSYVFSCFGHELAHGYDEYMELKSTGGRHSKFRDFEKNERNQELQNRIMNSPDKNVRDFGLLLHFIDETETQSYQHEICAEIKEMFKGNEDLTTFKTCNDIMMGTGVMKMVKENEMFLSRMKDGSLDGYREIFLQLFGYVYFTRGNFSYEDMVVFIGRRLIKVRKKIVDAAGGMFVMKYADRMRWR